MKLTQIFNKKDLEKGKWYLVVPKQISVAEVKKYRPKDSNLVRDVIRNDLRCEVCFSQQDQLLGSDGEQPLTFSLDKKDLKEGLIYGVEAVYAIPNTYSEFFELRMC